MARLQATDAAKQNVDVDWQAELARHDRWLRGVVVSRVGEPQAVDDVMQEIALAVVRQKAPLEDPTKVAPWLYRLAVTQSLLYRRSMGRRRKLTDRYAERFRPTESDSRTDDPLEWLLADERRAKVREAMRSLPSKDAEILLLKYAENWNYKKIAEVQNASVSAVEARLHRARARLRQRLAAMQVIETKS